MTSLGNSDQYCDKVLCSCVVPADLGKVFNERVDKLVRQAVKKYSINIEIKLSKSEGESIGAIDETV